MEASDMPPEFFTLVILITLLLIQRCLSVLVCLGTAMPLAEPFQNTIHGLPSTLKGVVTETKDTEQSFRKSLLDLLRIENTSNSTSPEGSQ